MGRIDRSKRIGRRRKRHLSKKEPNTQHTTQQTPTATTAAPTAPATTATAPAPTQEPTRRSKRIPQRGPGSGLHARARAAATRNPRANSATTASNAETSTAATTTSSAKTPTTAAKAKTRKGGKGGRGKGVAKAARTARKTAAAPATAPTTPAYSHIEIPRVIDMYCDKDKWRGESPEASRDNVRANIFDTLGRFYDRKKLTVTAVFYPAYKLPPNNERIAVLWIRVTHPTGNPMATFAYTMVQPLLCNGRVVPGVKGSNSVSSEEEWSEAEPDYDDEDDDDAW